MVEANQRLFAGQVDLLYQQVKGGALSALAAATIISLVVYPEVPPLLLAIWLSMSLMATGFRLQIWKARRRDLSAAQHAGQWLRRFHLNGARLDRLTGRHASLLASAENR